MKSRLGWGCSILLAVGMLTLRGVDAREEKPLGEEIIRLDASKAGRAVSRYLSGACIEDVNHEIYGGLYSQMIFGESFQEASAHQPLKRFIAYGGSWAIKGEELHGGSGDGPKLVSDHAAFSSGEVGVEVFFPDRKAGNAGLIVKTDKPRHGADNFHGYEVSLNPSGRFLLLGRHRNNWEPIQQTPCEVPVGQWIRLHVRMTEQSLEVLVNDKVILTYEDRQHPLKTGGFGLRQWQRPARYRKLWVKSNGRNAPVPFAANPDDIGPVSGMWRAFRRGKANGTCQLTTDRPFVGSQSQRMSFRKGEGSFGIENQGLNRWGLWFLAGKPYEGHLWVRAGKPVDLAVGLESRDGSKVYARARLAVTGTDWQRLSFTLSPTAADAAGRFVVEMKRPGTVELGYAFLQPGKWGRYKGLPLRRDVVEGMIDQGLTVLRFGGSMVNVDGYRWKKMIGPRDRRPPYRGMWYPHSTNGWGIVDFLDLCEAAGFLAIPAFNTGETPRDMADFIAYANGPADGEWGKKRAADGHPAPYRLKHIEFGNEERIDDKYVERFRAVAEAVWAVDPEVILVVGDFVFGESITDPENIKGAASGITSLSAHRKILDLARRHRREVWFDIHIDTEHPGALGQLRVVPSYVDALARMSGGAKHKVVLFELNSGNHAQRRGLANAIAVGSLQQLGGRLPIVCAANGLQPDGQNDNGWDQGLLFLNPSQVWLQPPGHVTRMIARSHQPVNVPAQLQKDSKLQVASARSKDGKTLVLRVVNAGDKPVPARLALDGFTATRETASVEELAAALDAVNTSREPKRVAPQKRQWRHGLGGAGSRYSFPAHSFTVLTFR